jgi:tetratricopeptide (TPR) repeat protein
VKRRARSAAIAALAALGLGAAACTPTGWSFRRGVRQYDAGRYADAFASFRRALARRRDPRIAYDAGAALYRMKRYDASARSYHDGTSDVRLRQRSFYNIGNAWFRASEDAPDPREPLERAIEAYENALQLDPRDRDAKWNLELAVRRLDDDRRSGGSRGRGARADYGPGNQRSGGYEGNPEAAVGAMAGGGHGGGDGESAHELTPAEAKRLLESVAREQLTTHEGHRLSRTKAGGHDW